MDENLIQLFTRLSIEIAKSEIPKPEDSAHDKIWEKEINSYTRPLRQKGLDTLLGKNQEEDIIDPCETDYGAYWSTKTVIKDCCHDLQTLGLDQQARNLEKSLELLKNDVNDSLIENQLKLLVLLKGAYVQDEPQSQHSFSFSKSDYFFKGGNSFMLIPKQLYSNEMIVPVKYKPSSKMSTYFNKAWNNDLNKGLVLLNKFVETTKSNQKTQIEIGAKSSKKLFNNKNPFEKYDHLLLDRFVEKPLNHGLQIVPENKECKNFLSNFKVSSEESIKRLVLTDLEEKYMWDTVFNDEQSENVLNDSIIDLRSKPKMNFSDYYINRMSGVSSESLINCLDITRTRRILNISSENTKTKVEMRPHVVLSAWLYEKKLLALLCPQNIPEQPKLRVLKMEEFISDIKFLLTGVSCQTFVYTNNHFKLTPGACLDNITPETLNNYCKEFIEIGDHFMKLDFVTKQAFVDGFDYGLVFQTFCKSIQEYLTWHTTKVLKLPQNIALIQLKHQVSDLHKTIVTISKLCNIWKNEVAHFSCIPKGGELLSYLYNKMKNIKQNVVRANVCEIFKNCCSVYIRFVQDWLFQGHIDEKNDIKDFFVEVNTLAHKTLDRNFYLDLFKSNKNYVPSFIKDLHESILNCGKFVHFLKLFSNEDKLCLFLEKKTYPSMFLCCSEKELSTLTSNYENYDAEARLHHGGKTSVLLIHLEEERQKLEQEITIKEIQRDIAEKNEIQRLEELKKIREKKEQQRQLLQKKRNEIDKEKIRRKNELEEEERKIQEEIDRINKQSEQLKEREKNRLLRQYESLFKEEERRTRRAEWVKERLQLQEKRIKFLLEEQENNQLVELDNLNNVDSEGNLVSKEVWSDARSDLLIEQKEIENSQPTITDNNVLVEENANFIPDGERIMEDNVEEITEAMRNKINYLKQEYDENVDVYTDVERNRLKQMTSTINDNELTEVQRNKRNYMLMEHGELSAVEINRNKMMKSNFEDASESRSPAKCREMTEAEINRQKYWKHEHNFEATEVQMVKQKNRDLTEAEKNKIKILGVEYNYRDVATNIPANNDTNFPVTDATKFPASVSTDTLKTPSDLGLGSSVFERTDLTHSSTFSSLLTGSSGNLIESVVADEKLEIFPPIVKSKSYQEALKRDEYFTGKDVEIFKLLKSNPEILITDYKDLESLAFKSFLIPIKIQEKLMNEAVLKHFLVTENLLSHLKSLRCYYFLHDGEFSRSLTNNLFVKLSECTEPCQIFERTTIKHIIQEALHYTVHSSEPNAENISFQIKHLPPTLNHSSHDVLSPFELSYHVKWPLNILLTETALGKYNVIFHFLVKLRRMSWNLLEIFKYLSYLPKSSSMDRAKLNQSNQYQKIHIYRHAMTQFVTTIETYISSHVLQDCWNNLNKSLESNEDFDNLYRIHVKYVKDVLKRCFLTKHCKEVMDSIHALIELSLKFYYTLISASWVPNESGTMYIHPKYQKLRSTFHEYGRVTKTFVNSLQYAIRASHDLRIHGLLLERLNIILPGDV